MKQKVSIRTQAAGQFSKRNKDESLLLSQSYNHQQGSLQLHQQHEPTAGSFSDVSGSCDQDPKELKRLEI